MALNAEKLYLETTSLNFRSDEIDIDYIIESGLLFEINRTIFHLFGMALTVKIDEQGKKQWSFKDLRERPEEAHFSPEVFRQGKKKLEKFLSEFGRAQVSRRSYCMGASCQSHPEYRQLRLFKDG